MKKALEKAVSERADFSSFQMQNEKWGRWMYIISSFYSLSMVSSPEGEEGQNVTWKIWIEPSTSHRQLKMSEPWMSYLLSLQGWDQIFFLW